MALSAQWMMIKLLFKLISVAIPVTIPVKTAETDVGVPPILMTIGSPILTVLLSKRSNFCKATSPSRILIEALQILLIDFST